MSDQPKPLTYERVLKMFRQTDRRMRQTDREMRRMSQETDRKFQETDRMFQEVNKQMKRTDKKISALGSRIVEIVECMVKGNIVEKFQTFGYTVAQSSRNVKFGNKNLPRGEIDLFLENGDLAILIEVKTTLETADVRRHLERIEKYRRCADAVGHDKRRFIGAVAGALVLGEAEEIAHENGMYVIVQSGKAVEIMEPPEGFKAREW